VLSQKLSEWWGQPVSVENHPGAGSTAGAALVAKSPADGYTLLLSSSAQAYSAALLKSLPYDPLKDFIPVAPLTSQPYVIVASKLAGIASVRELVAAAKAAFEAVSDSMRIEFSPFGVPVSAIAPGSISTPMLNRSPDQLNRLADALPKSLQLVYGDTLRAFAKTVVSAQRFSTSPAKASLTILRAVTAPRPRTRYLIGTDAKLSAFLKRNLPDRWMDAIIFRMFGLPRRVKDPEGELEVQPQIVNAGRG
jgi:NAD(P)-dependent dehydrogenase (short-subunit alcohol dehydrogenase family)